MLLGLFSTKLQSAQTLNGLQVSNLEVPNNEMAIKYTCTCYKICMHCTRTSVTV